METVSVAENIFWVGYTDWNVRNFHGYTTDKGSTYNSYLILDKKTALIDTVKAPYVSYLVKHIKNYTGLSDIDYVVCNHAEPDHSGGLPELMKLCKNASLVCNEKCRKTLSMHYDTSQWRFKVIDEKTELQLGKYSLKFVDTPMAHWPESMFTYIPEIKLLFSMDAFGQHYASSQRFDEEIKNISEVFEEAKTYYANIIMLYGNNVKKVFEKISGIDIRLIAPSHGIIWKSHIPDIINNYKDWVVCKPTSKVLIFYDTMWKSTEMMANAIYEGAVCKDVIVKKFDVKSTNITVLAKEVIDTAVLAVGSPTLNKGIMPKVAEALTYIRGLAPVGKKAMAFGSYGWAKKGGQHEVLEYLKSMNCELLYEEPLQAQYVPTEKVLIQCKEAGKKAAEIALLYK